MACGRVQDPCSEGVNVSGTGLATGSELVPAGGLVSAGGLVPVRLDLLRLWALGQERTSLTGRDFFGAMRYIEI